MSLIYLVGPRACGKTTLGKALSEVLDVPYCDTDHHLCERLGMDVATMVERWGWEGFLAEADTGSGLKFPRWARGYVTYIIPVGMLIVFAMGYAPIIAKWAGLG